MSRILSTSNEQLALREAVEKLRLGACFAIPTETVYGLAADATNGKAVAKIFDMKQRPAFNPLICHVDSLDMARDYGQFNEIALKLAQAFWPGPLTLVVPLAENSKSHDLVTAGLGSIGLRHPKGFSSKIISAFGKPLAAPSANVSGRVSPTAASHVQEEFYDSELLIIDDGPCQVGLESTIVKVEGGAVTLLRPGGITKEQIETQIECEVRLAKPVDGIQAPGMMASHYAPNAKVKLGCKKPEADAAWLSFGNASYEVDGPTLNLSETGNLIEAASNLYAFMKQLDATGTNKICVSSIPHNGLGIAINDRLKRAAAPRETI